MKIASGANTTKSCVGVASSSTSIVLPSNRTGKYG